VPNRVHTSFGHYYKQKLTFWIHSIMMYVDFIISHIHHLMNEFKIWIFAYNSDRRVYMFWYLIKSICFFSNIKKKEYLFLLIKFKEKK